MRILRQQTNTLRLSATYSISLFVSQLLLGFSVFNSHLLQFEDLGAELEVEREVPEVPELHTELESELSISISPELSLISFLQ